MVYTPRKLALRGLESLYGVLIAVKGTKDCMSAREDPRLWRDRILANTPKPKPRHHPLDLARFTTSVRP